MANESDVLKKDFDELRASVDKIMEDLKDLRAAQAEELKVKTRRKAQKAREEVEDLAANVSEKAKDSAETVDNMIRENPYRSMLAAFGLGLVIAQFIRRQ